MYFPLRLVILPDAAHVCEVGVHCVADQITAKPHTVFLLPTGATMLPLYARLVQAQREAVLDFGRVVVFNLDELYGLPPSHPGSYHAFLHRHLLNHVPVASANIRLFDGSAAAPSAHCADFEQALARSGGADMAILGIGQNGHIAFNEPGSDSGCGTRLVTLHESSRQANASLFGDIEAVPLQAFTVGIATILQSRQILLLATGRAKAQAVARMIGGPVDIDLPASALQNHPDVTVLLDEAAAAELDRAFLS